MANEQRTVWERYVASWRAVSAAERRTAFEACLAPDCVYTDPLTRTQGWDALAAYMLEFHRQFPGGHFVTEYFLAHHGSRLSEIEQRVPGICYGVVRQAEEDSEQLEYHAAIEVAEVGELPEGMVSVEVPAATYAKFAHRGPAPQIDHTVSYVYSTWLARSGRRHSYGPDLEIYGAEYHPTGEDSRLDYAIPIV
jgi:predicted transcriptional regulator YdeE